MPNGNVRPELLRAALNEADGFAFERFGNSFLGAIRGESFVPLGNYNDGGADAFLDERPAVVSDKDIRIYYQASKQKDAKSKIKHTIERLREFGRTPDRLIYITPREIKHIDKVTEELEDEFGVRIAIRDIGYLISHINDSDATKASYHNHLAHFNERLSLGVDNSLSPLSGIISHPEVYLFLSKEYSGDGSNESLIKSVTDTLILWALEGTDPERAIFLTSDEIEKKIENGFGVSVYKTIKGLVSHRLKALSTSSKPNRKIRVHKKTQFALPFDTREAIKAQNAEDVILRSSIIEIITERCSKILPEKHKVSGKECAEIAYDTIVRCFEHEGIGLYRFLEDSSDGEELQFSISDIVDKVIEDRKISDKEYIIKDAVIKSIHDSLYNGTIEEKKLFEKVSKAYAIFFMLKADPKITEYFSKMKSSFQILVGTEIILEALSEISLKEIDKTTTKTLKAIKDAGGRLFLTDVVADEITTHIQGTDYEFINKYMWMENSFDFYTRQQSSRILIESYLRAKHEPATGQHPPKSWEEYLNRFIDYKALHSLQAKRDMIQYLQFEYGLEYIDLDEMYDSFTPEDHVDVEEIFIKLKEHKKKEILAKNDALMAVYTFRRRSKASEKAEICNLGYKTWWLTREKSILPHVRHMMKRNCSKFMIRPEFLVNFIQLLPDSQDVRKKFSEAFPTTMSLSLSRHIEPEVFSSLLAGLREATEMNDSRRAVAISKLSDKLKGDFDKDYSYNAEEFLK